MKSTSSFRTTKFVSKLGVHHFAHLRGVAQGMDVTICARAYLGIEHGHEAVTAHRQTVDAVRAIARRSSAGPTWRLIGLTIRAKKIGLSEQLQRHSNEPAKAHPPSIEDFMAERDLQGWSEQEIVEMYTEAYPQPVSEATRASRRDQLMVKQMALIAQLEQLHVENPEPTDMVTGWFDDLTASKLIAAGMVNLGQLQAAIHTAGGWYRAMPGIGKGKANRIATFLNSLLPAEDAHVKPQFGLTKPDSMQLSTAQTMELVEAAGNPIRYGTISAPSYLRADTDMAAADAWISARAGSTLTAQIYRRESTRLMLWLQRERSGTSFREMSVEDCLDFMAFLQNIPDTWVSRKKAQPFAIGWAPFRGQLSHDSQKQSVTIIAALFQWLHAAGYIAANPWVLVNKRTGDDQARPFKQSKAISEFGFSEILRYIDDQAPTLQSERIRFIFSFLESVGLRSTEFLAARLEHFEHQAEGWVLHVIGKGSKARYAFIPNQAFNALQRYLNFRGLQGLEQANPKAPLVASVFDSSKPVGYQSFYETVRSWILRAIRASNLPAKERDYLLRASPHWLRHTFGTRSVARDVAMDAIQAQMGHASIKTTMDIYGRAPMKRRAAEIGKAFV